MSDMKLRGEKGAPSLLLWAGLACAVLMAIFGAVYAFRLSLLHRAIRQNDLRTINVLLTLDAALADSRAHPPGVSILSQAIQNQDYLLIEFLLSKGANPNIDNSLPLRIAAAKGYQDMIEKLLTSGADINGGEGIALGAALTSGNAYILKLLLDRGADPSAKNAILGACLAIRQGYFGISEVFIERGGGSRASDAQEDGDVMLLQAAVEKDAEQLIRLLLSKGADPNRIADSKTREKALGWAEKLRFAPATTLEDASS
jgi:ankyrin repeat protein